MGLCSLSLCAGVQGRPVGNSHCTEMNSDKKHSWTPSHSPHTRPSQNMEQLLCWPAPRPAYQQLTATLMLFFISSLAFVLPRLLLLLWSSQGSRMPPPRIRTDFGPSDHTGPVQRPQTGWLASLRNWGQSKAGQQQQRRVPAAEASAEAAGDDLVSFMHAKAAWFDSACSSCCSLDTQRLPETDLLLLVAGVPFPAQPVLLQRGQPARHICNHDPGRPLQPGGPGATHAAHGRPARQVQAAPRVQIRSLARRGAGSL